jgi:hypothetical protein
MLCACGGGTAPQLDAGPPQSESGDGAVMDSDHDGLCDATELELGTDPRVSDTDGDALPDWVEVGNGFDPNDPTSPAPDQLARLEAQTGAGSDFPVRSTVQGDGQGLTGAFQSFSSAYADGATAGDFLTAAIAVSADPVDGVRRIDAQQARFESVLGPTRLGFSLHFDYAGDAGTPTCAKAYPFRYGTKSDDGSTRSTRLFLLVVEPPEQPQGSVQYCLPDGCQ